MRYSHINIPSAELHYCEKVIHLLQLYREIRRIIYTTDTIEGFHRQVRKETKARGAFPNDDALLKLVQ